MRRVAGIDVGGTFTDLILFDDRPRRRRVRLAKTPTTRRQPGLRRARGARRRRRARPPIIDLIVHGTTTTTNAVLERKLARVGLITTRGFRDILELGRRTRPQPYGMTGTLRAADPARAAARGGRAHRARRATC